MPDEQRELEAAWQALAERERRGDEATRQRAAELEERSARVSALWEELSERSTELTAQEVDLRNREEALASGREELERKDRLVRDAEAAVEAGRTGPFGPRRLPSRRKSPPVAPAHPRGSGAGAG